MLALEADPRPSAALFGWILGHGVVGFEDVVDGVGGDAEIVANAQDVGDRADAEVVVDGEDAVGEVVGMVGVGVAAGGVELGPSPVSRYCLASCWTRRVTSNWAATICVETSWSTTRIQMRVTSSWSSFTPFSDGSGR